MKCLIVCESVHHGNTEKIAKAMRRELKADLKKPSEVGSIESYDLIGFGSGIYHARHHRSLFEFVGRLDLKDKKVFVFSTAGMPFLTFFNHLHLKSKLKSAGAEIVGDVSYPGLNTHGPYGFIGGLNKNKPGNNEIKKARDFAKKLAQPQ